MAIQDDEERQPLLQGQKVANGDVTNYNQGIPINNGLDAPPADEPTSWECFKILLGFYFGTFFAALDSTLIATLTATISDSFDSLALLSWVASGYLIANAAIQPLSGKLTDIYGRKTGFLLATAVFTIGNLICALAQREWVMIVGRLVAGAGGGCLNTIATFVAGDIIPLRKRALWQGISNVNYGIGLAIGGVLGGWINDFAGWRWAFGFQIPLSILSAIQVWYAVKLPTSETKGSKLKRIDFLGSFTLVTSLILLLLGLNSGGNIVPWNHPLVLVSLPLSVLFLLAFIYTEINIAIEPVIPMDQLANRTVLAACFTNSFGSMAFHGLFFYFPLYFQLQGDSTSAAGSKLVASSIGTGLGSITVGLIMRRWGKYYWLNVSMMIIFIGVYACVSQFRLNTPVWPTIVCLFLFAFSYVGMLTITLTAFVAAVEHQYQAVITAASYAFRSVGSTVGITICSAVFQNVLSDELWSQLGDRKNANEIIPRVRDRLSYIKELDPSWKKVVLNIYMDAFGAVFYVLLAISIIAGIVSLFMKEHILYTTMARRSSNS